MSKKYLMEKWWSYWSIIVEYIRLIWSFLKLSVWLFALGIFTCMLTSGVYHAGDKTRPLIPNTASLIDTKPMPNMSAAEKAKHNAVLINRLEGERAFDAALASSREASKMQTRAFYLASLAALSSVLLLRDKDVKTKRRVGKTMLFLILGIYVLEVHLDDTFARSRAYSDNIAVAINLLVNGHLSTPDWYIYRYDDFSDQLTAWGSTTLRWGRKISNFFKPDFEKLVLYVFPGLLISGWLLFFGKDEGWWRYSCARWNDEWS